MPGLTAGHLLVASEALMANIKSQIKRNKQNDRRAEKNKAVRTSLKTSTKKVRTAVAAGDAEVATAQALDTARALDKAASKGMSRLAKAANKVAASASAE
jgi:small subunit ribosomal protein S20